MQENELKEKLVNDVALEIVSKSIIKEANEIGFQRGDYVKLANLILDSALHIDNGNGTNHKSSEINNGYSINKKVKLPLIGNNVLIREFNKKTDIDLLKKWFNEKKGRYFILSRAALGSSEVEHLVEDNKHLFGIVTLKDETPIGVLAFLNYDKEQSKAELRKLIGEPEYRGKGFGKEATKLWIQYGIASLDLHKIYLNTLQTNVTNIRLNEELGFKVEGILRDDCFIEGKYFDLLRMSLIVNNVNK